MSRTSLVMISLFSLCLLLPTLVHADTPPAKRNPDHAVAIGMVVAAPRVTRCMQGATHRLNDDTGNPLYQLRADDKIPLADMLDRHVRVSGAVQAGLADCPPLMIVETLEALTP